MANYVFRYLHFAVVLKVSFVVFNIQYCFSKPVETVNFFSLFLKDLSSNNCALPSQIQLPFQSEISTVEAFSSSLSICQNSEYFKYNMETPLLCSEIFGLLKNISCVPKDIPLPEIKIALSSEVCKDFALHNSILPEGLMKHLSDNFVCNVMCKEKLEAPCQILLWSFLVQISIKNALISKTVSEVSHSLVEEKQGPISNVAVEKSKANVDSHPAPINQNKLEKKNDDIAKKLIDEPKVESVDQKVDIKLDNTEQNMVSEGIQKLNEQISKVKDNTTVSNPLTSKDKFTEPEKAISMVDKGKDLEVDKKDDNDLQTEVSPSNAEDDDGVHDTGIPLNESDPSDSHVPQNKVIKNVVDKVPLSTPVNKEKKQNNLAPSDTKADAKEEELKKTNELEPQQNTIDNVAKNKQTPILTIPGFKAEYRENIAQLDQKNTSLKKDEIADTVPADQITESSKKEGAIGKTSTSETVSSVLSQSGPNPTPVISTIATVPLEKMDDEYHLPLPGDKDLDQYNDPDNADGDTDGEYNKQEYDSTLDEPIKKETNSETPSAVNVQKESTIVQNEGSKGYSDFSSRDTFGRGSDEIQVIASFPDQEDSHFFFYFLSLVLILMAGYLIFHNKQKIIALIVEGRHERRRRSHGLGYKKLETK